MKDCRIFINYRRSDYKGSIKQFYRLLKRIYGDVVYLDDYWISYGDRFEEKIKPGVINCSLFLSCIGPNWDRQKNLDRLRDKRDWVRREMELAKDQAKHIVPILFDRDDLPAVDKLPTSLQQGIFDGKWFKMGEDEDYWEDEIKRIHPVIETYTNLKPQNVTTTHSIEEKSADIICHLDRSTQFVEIKNRWEDGRVLFSASGTDISEIESFTKRCILHLKHNVSGKLLIWEEFCATDKSAREKQLAKSVAEELSVETQGKGIEELKNEIHRKLANEPAVFYSIRRRSSPKNQVSHPAADWWQAWNSLIGGRRNLKVMVLLFTIPGWKNRLFGRLARTRLPPQDLVCLKPFGPIKKEEFDEWRVKYKNDLGGLDQSGIEKIGRKLFRFGRRRPYKHVEVSLKMALQQSGGSNLESG